MTSSFKRLAKEFSKEYTIFKNYYVLSPAEVLIQTFSIKSLITVAVKKMEKNKKKKKTRKKQKKKQQQKRKEESEKENILSK